MMDTVSHEQSLRGGEPSENFNVTRENFMRMIRLMNSTNKSNGFRMTFGTTGRWGNDKPSFPRGKNSVTTHDVSQDMIKLNVADGRQSIVLSNAQL